MHHKPKSKSFDRWLRDLRRSMHMYPEIGLQEVRTTKMICRILSEFGIEYYRFDNLTGAVALIRGGQSGKTLCLRADIDALPIQELNDTPYRSRIADRMHACGHDAHTAIMLGVARRIVESDVIGSLKGNVKFIFQPAEENHGGAALMIAQGVLDDPYVDQILACHVDPELPVGSMGVYHAQSHASIDTFKLSIAGKGGHSGRPHQTIDPIVAGAHFVTELQSIVARNVNPIEGAVISIGKFISGDTENVIPHQAEIAGSIRALSPEVRKILSGRVEAIAKGTEQAFGVTCELNLQKGYPICFNDPKVSKFMYHIGTDILGPDKVSYLRPSLGGEDFSYYTEQRPGAIVRLGCGNGESGEIHPLHSPHFDIVEDSLSVGVEIFTKAVCRYLS